MQEKAEWTRYKNILCFRPDNLGDILMTSPAFRALKEAVPDRKITLLTSSAGAAIAKYLPEIDEIIEFNLPWVKNEGASSEEVFPLIERLKKGNFDASVIFTVYSQNPMPAAMLCYMAGIQNVAAYCRENPYHLISNWVPDREPLYDVKHEVLRQLELVKSIGAYTESDDLTVPVISKDASVNAFEKLTRVGVNPGQPWLIVHPGVSEAKRQYSPEFLAQAVALIKEKLGYQVVLTGVSKEEELTEYIIKKAGDKVYSLAGKLSLEECIALINEAPVLISNNTGPVHIAAAMKTPVVVLYALTNPQHVPWKINHKLLPFDVPKSLRSKNVVVGYAYDKCFLNQPKMVTPQQILEGVEEVIKGNPKDYKTELLLL